MTTEVISPDLKLVLRRLKLSPLLDTLPDRLVLARQQKIPHQDWLLHVRRQAFFLISDNQNSPWVFKVASAGQARSEALCCP